MGHCGFVAMWFCGLMLCDTAALWFCAVVVLWPRCNMALWRWPRCFMAWWMSLLLMLLCVCCFFFLCLCFFCCRCLCGCSCEHAPPVFPFSLFAFRSFGSWSTARILNYSAAHPEKRKLWTCCCYYYVVMRANTQATTFIYSKY